MKDAAQLYRNPKATGFVVIMRGSLVTVRIYWYYEVALCVALASSLEYLRGNLGT